MNPDFLQIYIEALQNAFLLPLNTEPTLHALAAFGTNLVKPILSALLGAGCGVGLSWWMGKIIGELCRKGKFKLTAEQYGTFTCFMHKYGIWLLPFSFASIGGILPLLAGFTRIPLLQTVALVLAGRLIYYLVTLHGNGGIL